MRQNMSENDSKKLSELEARTLKTQHIHSTENDEVIMIGADLIPDDIDMFPRLLGSREAPFRSLFAETVYADIDAIDERSRVGGNYPFADVCTKHINGLPFPGLTAGYGWIYCVVQSNPDGSTLHVVRSSYNNRCYEIQLVNGLSALVIHPTEPYAAFSNDSTVLAEITRLGLEEADGAIQPDTSYKRLKTSFNAKQKVNQITFVPSVPQNVCTQFELLIKLY